MHRGKNKLTFNYFLVQWAVFKKKQQPQCPACLIDVVSAFKLRLFKINRVFFVSLKSRPLSATILSRLDSAYFQQLHPQSNLVNAICFVISAHLVEDRLCFCFIKSANFATRQPLKLMFPFDKIYSFYKQNV